MIKCKVCDTETKNKTYCSYKCRDAGYIGPRDPTKIISCKICQNKTTNKVYCCEKCQHIGSKVSKVGTEERKCIHCENIFVIRRTKKNKLCSRKCSDLYKKNIMMGNKNCSHTEEYKKNMSAFMKNIWKNAEYVKQVKESKKKTAELLGHPIGHDPDSAKKRAETIKKYSLEKYGTEHPFCSTAFRQEAENICVEKYGKKSYEIAAENIDEETIEKRRRTLIETLFGIPYEEYENRLSHKEKYYKQVRAITESQPLYLLENYDKRGMAGEEGCYHLDHIIPISYGLINNISPEIIGNISNLRFIPWLDNLKKGCKYENKDQEEAT